LFLKGATIQCAACNGSGIGIYYKGSKNLSIYTEGDTPSTINGSAEYSVGIGIFTDNSATLTLYSKNSSTLSIYPDGKVMAYGIICHGNLSFFHAKLTIDCSKSLNGSATFTGILSSSDMLLQSFTDVRIYANAAKSAVNEGAVIGGSLTCLTLSNFVAQCGASDYYNIGLQVAGAIDIKSSTVTASAGSGTQSYGIQSVGGSITIDRQSSLASAGGDYGLVIPANAAAHSLTNSGCLVLTGSTPVNIKPADANNFVYTTDAVSDVSADGITIKGNTAKYDSNSGIPAAAKTYGSMPNLISVAGTDVTYDNASDILQNGKVSYDLKTNTLTFDHADIDCSANSKKPIYCDLPTNYQQPFTLRLIGSNKIVNCSAPIAVYEDFNIGGTGDLTVNTSDEHGIEGLRSLTIKDSASLNLTFDRYAMGIYVLDFILDTSGTVVISAPSADAPYASTSFIMNFVRGTMILHGARNAFFMAELHFGPGVTAIAATNYEGTEGVVHYTGTELDASDIKYLKVYDIIYVPIPATYTAPTSDTIAGGKLDSSQPPTSGSDYSCTIVPDSGRQLPSSIKVSVAGSDLTADQFVYDSATGKVTIPARYVTGAIKITAVCTEVSAPAEVQRVKVQATASPAAGGTVTGGKTVAAGSAVTLKAVPKPGYMFVKWLKSSKTVSRKATLVMKNVQVQASSGSSSDASSLAKLNYIAVFKRLPVNFT